MGCEIPTYTTDPMSMSQLNWIWYTYQVKLLELIETMFYILRNKPEQASVLHLYHHTFVIMFVWLGIKYFAGIFHEIFIAIKFDHIFIKIPYHIGGMAGLPIIVNSSVHILMYSYYYLASICNAETRKKITKFKKALTMVQMVSILLI